MSTDWLNRRRGVLAASGNVTLRRVSDGVPFPNAARTPRLRGEGLAPRLRGEGLAPRLRGEGLAPRLLGAVSRPLVMAMLVGAMALTARAEVTDMVIDVAEGQTVTRSEEISGEVRLVKTGLGTLILSAANTYSGGTALSNGVIEVQNQNALGTGEVEISGSISELHQLKFRVPQNEAWIANAITLEGSSSKAYPAFNFATNTYLSGAITANGDLYMVDTAYSNSVEAATSANIVLKGAVTVGAGFRISGAPHCLLSFGGVLKTPILECGYVDGGQASNGGNAGSFLLTQKANGIGTIKLIQTCIKCGAANICTNTTLDWTDAKLKDDAARFDMSGYSQSVFDIITPFVAKGGEGCVITNSVAGKALDFAVRRLAADPRYCFARFDGPIGFRYTYLQKLSRVFAFTNRCHSMSGSMVASEGRVDICGGSAFPNVVSFSNSQGKPFNVYSEEENVLDGVTSISIGSPTWIFSEAAVRSLSKGRRVALARTTSSSSRGGLTLYGSTPLQVKSFQNSSPGGSTAAYYYPAGEYTSARSDTTFKFGPESSGSKLTGTVLVWGDNSSGVRTGWTNMVWTGASTSSSNVNDLANYEVLPQYATFKVPIAWLHFGNGNGYAEIANDVYWGGLTFTNATEFALKKGADSNPTIHLYDHPISIYKEDGDETPRTFTIEPTLDLQCAVPSAPEGDTLVLSGGIATNNLAIPAANAGTIELGGLIPTNLVINGGVLAIAEDAVLPDGDVIVLTIADGAKISVPAGKTLRTKTTTYAGTQVEVGYFDATSGAAFMIGEGKVRVEESTTPTTTTETITWKGAGDTGTFSAATNWDPEEVNLGWANKYTTVFAKDGVETTGAVVDGAYSLVGMQFSKSLGNFTLKAGDNAALTIGAGGITFEDGKDVTTERTITIEPAIEFLEAPVWKVPTNDTLVISSGVATNNFVIDAESEGTIVLGGTIPLTNTVYGTLAFADDATLPEDDTMVLNLGDGATIKVNEGRVLKVKSVTTNGVAVAVGFFADGFVTGGGKVRVNESSAAMVPEAITWKGGGDAGEFSAATNWDPEEVNLGWANKYTTVFAKSDVETTGAVVDGAYSLIGMQLATTLGNFTFKKQEGTSSLAIGSGNIAFTEGRETTDERTITFETPVSLSTEWESNVPANDKLVFTNGLTMSNKLTLNGEGTIELYGTSSTYDDLIIYKGKLVISGTYNGTGSGSIKMDSYDRTGYSLWLNEAHVNRNIYFGITRGSYRVRSSAPVGTTNYIASISDNGTTTTYFEYGRVFVITNFNVYAKHALYACGNSADGPMKIIAVKATQGSRPASNKFDGHLTVGNNVELSIGSVEKLTSNMLSLSGANSVLRFMTDDLLATNAARTAQNARLDLTAGNVYLGSTHQQFSTVHGTVNATIHGDSGSVVEIKSGTNKVGNANCRCCLADSVSLVMNGPLTNWVNGVSTTDGELTVKAGTLFLSGDASLPNLRAVNVSGGVLAIAAADPFGHTTTALNVTGGTIDLTSEEVTLWCDSATVDGAAVKIGTYTATNPGAFTGYLTGAGKIRVGTPGTYFIIK